MLFFKSHMFFMLQLPRMPLYLFLQLHFLLSFFLTLDKDPKLLATHARKAGAIAFMGMAIPFALGVAISPIMFDTLQVNFPPNQFVDLNHFSQSSQFKKFFFITFLLSIIPPQLNHRDLTQNTPM